MPVSFLYLIGKKDAWPSFLYCSALLSPNVSLELNYYPANSLPHRFTWEDPSLEALYHGALFFFFSFYNCCILGRILYWAIIQLACTDHPTLIFLAAEIVSSFKINLGIYFQDKDDLRISRLNSFGFWWGFKIIAFELNLNSSDWAFRKEAGVFKKTQQ